LWFQNKHGNQHGRWKGSGEGAEMGLGGEDDDKAQGKGGEDHGAQQVDQTDEVCTKWSLRTWSCFVFFKLCAIPHSLLNGSLVLLPLISFESEFS
jgi:hypothetical protein